MGWPHGWLHLENPALNKIIVVALCLTHLISGINVHMYFVNLQ